MALFNSKKDVKLNICERSVGDKKPFSIDKSEPKRLLFKCHEKRCSFKLLLRSNANDIFQLIEERPHDCLCELPTIKRLWARERIAEVFEDDPRIKPKDLKERFREKYDVDVDISLLTNALLDVKKAFSFDNQAFGLLSSFLTALEKENEGTTTCVQSQDGIFQRAFLFPGMCSRAFYHTPKIVGLDACHIKARYGGVMMVMTLLDGNGSIFPAAVGIAESEKTETWSWFLHQVEAALHIPDGGDGVVFLSDREKGIETSIKEVFPQACQGFCVFHIQKNVKRAHHTSLDGLLFKAAKAATVKEFEEKLALMKALDDEAAAYIAEIDKAKWARAFFPVRRLGHVTSNIAESMNRWLEEARWHDPVGLFSIYVLKLNNLFEKRRDKYASLSSHALPKRVAQLYDNSVNKSRKLILRRHTKTIFQVRARGEMMKKRWKIVDLDNTSCTCGFYREYEIPCQHMCAVLLSLRDETPSRLIHRERLRDSSCNLRWCDNPR